jgi:hypothetical protein
MDEVYYLDPIVAAALIASVQALIKPLDCNDRGTQSTVRDDLARECFGFIMNSIHYRYPTSRETRESKLALIKHRLNH